jgi:hypothetical protein
VMDQESGVLVPAIRVPGKTRLEHELIIPVQTVSELGNAVLTLPAGHYRLNYRLLPYTEASRKYHACCYEGSIKVELVVGEVTTIQIGD